MQSILDICQHFILEQNKKNVRNFRTFTVVAFMQYCFARLLACFHPWFRFSLDSNIINNGDGIFIFLGPTDNTSSILLQVVRDQHTSRELRPTLCLRNRVPGPTLPCQIIRLEKGKGTSHQQECGVGIIMGGISGT